jgi:hypothetical protein
LVYFICPGARELKAKTRKEWCQRSIPKLDVKGLLLAVGLKQHKKSVVTPSAAVTTHAPLALCSEPALWRLEVPSSNTAALYTAICLKPVGEAAFGVMLKRTLLSGVSRASVAVQVRIVSFNRQRVLQLALLGECKGVLQIEGYQCILGYKPPIYPLSHLLTAHSSTANHYPYCCSKQLSYAESVTALLTSRASDDGMRRNDFSTKVFSATKR